MIDSERVLWKKGGKYLWKSKEDPEVYYLLAYEANFYL